MSGSYKQRAAQLHVREEFKSVLRSFGGRGLQPVHIEHLLTRVPRNEQKDILDTHGQCLDRALKYGGGPCAVLALASTFAARQCLPAKYRPGPLASILVSMGVFAPLFLIGSTRIFVKPEVQPKVVQLLQKYATPEALEAQKASEVERKTFGGVSKIYDWANRKLNSVQIAHLLSKVSSDEMKDIQDTYKECRNEAMTGGILFALLGTYFVSGPAFVLLPAKYHFGPKSFAVCILALFTLMSKTHTERMGEKRVLPKIDQLWQKYAGAETEAYYAALRNKDTYAPRQRQNSFSRWDTFLYGTPSGERLEKSGDQTKTISYGDVGFA